MAKTYATNLPVTCNTQSLKRLNSKMVPPTTVEIASPFSLANLLKALRQHWILALSVGLALFAVSAGTIEHLVTAHYTAYTLLQVRGSDPQHLTSSSADRHLENTMVATIKSRPLLQDTLLRPGIAELNIVRSHKDPASWLEENLKVGFLGETDILRLSLEGTEPEELATLVNAVKDTYMDKERAGQQDRKPAPPGEGTERLKSSPRSNEEPVIVLHPAEAPTQKNMLKKATLVGLVGTLGFSLGLFSVGSWEVRSQRTRRNEDNEQPRQTADRAVAQAAGQAGDRALEQPRQVQAA
jgi:uncharacterized protein involved in exopolysaccharide biosynthesis